MTAVVHGPVAPRRVGTASSRLPRVGRALGTAFLVLSMAVLAGAALLPHLGVRLLTIESGSMAPRLPVGALVLEQQVPIERLAPGMVLSFYPPTEEQRLVTHRVVSVDRTRGGTIVETRGDANAAADPWLAELLDERVWVVTGTVPAVGRLADLARTPAGLVALAFVLPVVFAASTLRLIWRRPAAQPRHRRERTPIRLTRRGRVAVRTVAVLLGAVVVFVGAGLPDSASARFSTAVSRGHTAAFAVLLAPAVTATGNCLVLGSTIQVSWTPASAGETSYRIERRVGAGAWSTVATVPSSTQTYQDAGVTYLITYTYRVTGLRSTWTSPTGATPSATLGATCR